MVTQAHVVLEVLIPEALRLRRALECGGEVNKHVRRKSPQLCIGDVIQIALAVLDLYREGGRPGFEVAYHHRRAAPQQARDHFLADDTGPAANKYLLIAHRSSNNRGSG